MMHPMMKLALMRCEDPEEVEVACKGNWDRCQIEEPWLYVLRRDGTVKREFVLQPVERRMPHIMAAGRCIICGVKMHQADRGKECPKGAVLTPTSSPWPATVAPEVGDTVIDLTGTPQVVGAVFPEGPAAADLQHVAAPASAPRSEGEAPVSAPDAEPVQEQSVPDVVPGTPRLVVDDYPPCPCGCGQPVINAPTGRQRKWASDACRRANAHKLAAERKREMQPTTDVPTSASRSVKNTSASDTSFSPPPEDLELPAAGNYAADDALVLVDDRRKARDEYIAGVKATAPPGDTVWVECGQVERHHPHWWALDGDVACTGAGCFTEWMPEQREAPVQPPPQPVDTPVNVEIAGPIAQRRSEPCTRCDEVGHDVASCPFPTRRVAMRAKNPEVKKKPAFGKPAFVKEKEEVITCGKCREKGHSTFTCTKPVADQRVVVRPVISDLVTDDQLTSHGQALVDMCKDGLPLNLQYSYHPDVLALYGVDHDLLDACLRHPQRVELRPESHDRTKRYAVLGFTRGDIQAILGMRTPSAPMVIAVYVDSLLEHDIHRVGYSGGGGAKKGEGGLPKTSKQVVTRLRAMGAEVEIDPRQKTAPVTYQGQDLGQIACEGDRTTCEQDFQRVQRKMAAIDRRVSA